MNVTAMPSPNFDSREGVAVDMIVLHYTDTLDCAEALSILTDPAAKVSSHYVLDIDGTIHQLVDEKERAWHAGTSSWRGHDNVNHRSIGIEIVNPGHRYGLAPYPKKQMEALVHLCDQLVKKYRIEPRNVVGHSDVAPSRKTDPGEHFNWAWMAERGIGLWPLESTPAAMDDATALAKLAEFGYGVQGIDKEYAFRAFQRRYRPKPMTGAWDEECAGMLEALLKMI